MAPEPERADIVIYTKGWLADGPTHGDEEPLAMLYGRVFVNGDEIPRALSANVEVSNDFTSVTVKLSPSTVKVVPLNEDDWKAL